MPEFLDFKQVLEVVHLSRSRVNQLLAQNAFPRPHKLAPGKSGRLIWPRQAVETWLASKAPKAA